MRKYKVCRCVWVPLVIVVVTVWLFIAGWVNVGIVLVLNQIEITKLEVRGRELVVNNDINEKTYAQFSAALKNNRDIDTITLERVSGSLDDDTLLKIGYFIREKGLKTKLLSHSKVESGGVDLFLSGVERTIEISDDGKYPYLGVHAWSSGINDATDYPQEAKEHDLHRNYTEYMLGSDDFYWFSIGAATPEDIYKLSPEDIHRYGLATAILMEVENIE